MVSNAMGRSRPPGSHDCQPCCPSSLAGGGLLLGRQAGCKVLEGRIVLVEGPGEEQVKHGVPGVGCRRGEEGEDKGKSVISAKNFESTMC